MKEANLKRLHILGFQLYYILEKAKLWKQEKDQWLPGWGTREKGTGRTQRICRAVELSCIGTIMVDTCHHTFVQTQRIYSTSGELYCKRWTLSDDAMSNRFIDCNKRTTLLGNVDDEGGCACGATGDIRESSAPSAPFCCESKTDLKNQVYLQKRETEQSRRSCWEPLGWERNLQGSSSPRGRPRGPVCPFLPSFCLSVVGLSINFWKL